ncbi:MAG: DUF2238 domain-containing protein [Actinomycetota bacterium]
MMRKLLAEQRVLSLFFLTYYLGLIAYGVATGNGQAAFYALFIGVAALIVGRLYGVTPLSSLVLWGLACWGLAHMVGGLVEISGEVIYNHSLGGGEFRFDKVVHFFGFGFATLAAYEVLKAIFGRSASSRGLAATALFVGLGLGAINETIEFLITRLPWDSNVGGFSNTGWDLVANALGAAMAAMMANMLGARLGGGE